MSLRFGIPRLDSLIEIPPVGASESYANLTADTTSVAILGPDGSGKSVLALHLASRYLADCIRRREVEKQTGQHLPLVLYVSSDFSHPGAARVWGVFGLGSPETRNIPGERMSSALQRMKASKVTIGLEKLHPEGDDVAKYLTSRHIGPDFRVGFLDLATQTAGDDWHYVNGILAKLGSIPRFEIDKSPMPHLVIVDSVAGFETFVGTVDAYGLEQTRRARIAQSLRHGGANCHLVFVVEEPKVDERLPEEYVTDIVIRLRSRNSAGVHSRTMEVEKARSRNHALGEHPYQIRGREGSSTGEWENMDTPQCRNAYVQVFRSLAHRNFLTAREHSAGAPGAQGTRAQFGIEYLDNMLVPGKRVLTGQEGSGLVTGTASAVIGDSSTGKSMLAQKFLVHALLPILMDALEMYQFLAEGKTDALAHDNLLGLVGTPIIGGVKPDNNPFSDTWSMHSRNGLCESGRAANHLVTPKTLG